MFKYSQPLTAEGRSESNAPSISRNDGPRAGNLSWASFLRDLCALMQCDRQGQAVQDRISDMAKQEDSAGAASMGLPIRTRPHTMFFDLLKGPRLSPGDARLSGVFGFFEGTGVVGLRFRLDPRSLAERPLERSHVLFPARVGRPGRSRSNLFVARRETCGGTQRFRF